MCLFLMKYALTLIYIYYALSESIGLFVVKHKKKTIMVQNCSVSEVRTQTEGIEIYMLSPSVYAEEG